MSNPTTTLPLEELERFCWDAGVLTLVGTQGFQKAAANGFLERGYRLATISRDFEPFDYIHKLSLYMIGDQPRLGRREAMKLAQGVLKKVGLRLKPDDCHVEVSGRRLVVSVALPYGLCPHIQLSGKVPVDGDHL